jgi:hypothetical protein
MAAVPCKKVVNIVIRSKGNMPKKRLWNRLKKNTGRLIRKTLS